MRSLTLLTSKVSQTHRLTKVLGTSCGTNWFSVSKQISIVLLLIHAKSRRRTLAEGGGTDVPLGPWLPWLNTTQACSEQMMRYCY